MTDRQETVCRHCRLESLVFICQIMCHGCYRTEISLHYILKLYAAYKCKDQQKLEKIIIIRLHPEAKSQKISYALNSFLFFVFFETATAFPHQ